MLMRDLIAAANRLVYILYCCYVSVHFLLFADFLRVPFPVIVWAMLPEITE